jgi:hypothetical protein
MTKDELNKMQDDIKVQDELKAWIKNPRGFDFHHGSSVNDYKGDMHRFSIHAKHMLRDMLVAHAEYLVQKIDDDLKAKGVD